MPRDITADADLAEALDSELDGHYFEDLAVGMTAVYSRTITESDIVLFCVRTAVTN